YGPLTTRFGLALDNLLGAEIVLADGRLVIADATKNADLFWALRGGGGNFGVVTSMRLRLHPVSELLAGLMLFPWSEAKTVLRGHAKLMSSAPDELSVLAGLVPAPDGSPLVFLGPIWSGEPGMGGEIMDRLTCLGTPIVSRIGPMSPSDLLALYDTHIVNGRHYALRTHWLADLTPDVVGLVVAAGAARTSPHTLIALHHFHGAGTRIPPGATAFGERRAHYMIEIIAAWEPADAEDGARHRQWAQDLSSNLAPLALPGGYPNFLTAENREQLAAAYGANGSRLRELKRRYDPDDVFSSAIPIPE
ncbi:MAG: FAD-binding oxidoreductase, partial [Hypericibacter sp.]